MTPSAPMTTAIGSIPLENRRIRSPFFTTSIDVLPTTEFPHTLVDAHPFYRSSPWKNWTTLVGGLYAYGDVGRLARQFKPALIVGTGGYASGVALGWAAMNSLPIVQHIGDSYPGATARFFARYTTEAYLGYPEAEQLLPHRGCVYRDTGNPIDPPPDIRPAPTEENQTSPSLRPQSTFDYS